MTTNSVRVSAVMHAMFDGCDGVVECRSFHGGAPNGRLFSLLEDTDRIRAFWQEHQTHNLFWGVATRRDDRDGTLGNCLHLPAFFADCDFKLSSETTVRQRLTSFPLSPSAVIMSGGGLQPYWFLKEPVEVPAESERVRELLRRLAAYLDADIVAGEPARVLRVPGTLNNKYTPPRRVQVETFDPDRRYNPSDFDFLPALPIRTTAPPVDLSKVINESRNVTLYKLARALKGKKLPDAAIVSAVRTVNSECCAPPLEEWEIKQVLHNALTQPDRPMTPGRVRMEVAADAR
jgi:hypothetical protein